MKRGNFPGRKVMRRLVAGVEDIPATDLAMAKQHICACKGSDKKGRAYRERKDFVAKRFLELTGG